MNHGIKLLLTGVVLGAMALTGCNKASDDDDSDEWTDTEASTLVSGFAIKPNTKVMANLDSVYFSIDQINAEIYNADSLPSGTDVRKLVVTVKVPSSAAVELIMPKLDNSGDTTINLNTNPNDSINFSSGRVWLRLESGNGKYTRIYNVKVNVHKMNPDSLQWRSQKQALPGSLANPAEQWSTQQGDDIYSLERNQAGDVQLCHSSNPLEGEWTRTTPTLPADAVLRSFTATDDAFYILSSDGKLFTAADPAGQWTETGQTGWSYIYGGYGTDVIGVQEGKWLAYPSGKTGAIPAAMPVSGTSQMWTYSNSWMTSPQAMFVGGRLADGSLSNAAWGFDGYGWMQLNASTSQRVIPAAEGVTLFPYFTYRVEKTNFAITKQSAWIALGGKTADGSVHKDVYITLDNGINWLKGSESLTLPAEITARSGASVQITNKTYTIGSRADLLEKPITEWDAPFILLLGGNDASGHLFNEMHVGVINRLTFKPLQ